ncbi:proline-rich family protein [Aureococcus anophagefferens]|uniref:Proline-rich family protein n=1 Tax=Aureococcus anophagefferens TaxID=44056 RepID=A0ABR1FZ44_AURAN
MCLCFFARRPRRTPKPAASTPRPPQDDSPHENDARGGRQNMFKTGMQDAPCKDPLACCCGGLPCFLPFTNCYMRHKALEGNMDAYVCCQGYYDRCCFKAGSIGDQGNPCCLALEGFCCLSCSLSSTRMYVMDKYDLQSDPCDRRIIRFNNCVQMLACICHLAAMFDPSFRDLANILDLIADIVFYTTAGCMHAQVHYELTEREKSGTLAAVSAGGGGQFAAAPKYEPEYPSAPRPQQMAHQNYPPAGQPRTFPVVIPEGVYAGTQLQVQAPNGQTMMFAVPPGAAAGQQVMVPY